MNNTAGQLVNKTQPTPPVTRKNLAASGQQLPADQGLYIPVVYCMVYISESCVENLHFLVILPNSIC